MSVQTKLNEQRLNSATDGNQDNFDVSPLADGGFVAVWENFRPGFLNEPNIQIAIFNEDGTQRVAEREVSNGSTSEKRGPGVAVLSTGEFIVVWVDKQIDPGRDTLEVRVLQADLTPKLSNTFSLPAPFSNQPNLDSASVQALPDGEAIILGRTPNSMFGIVVDNDQGIVQPPQEVGRTAQNQDSSLATTFDQNLIDAENGSIQTFLTAFRSNSRNVLRLEHYGIDGTIGPGFFNRTGQQDVNLGAAGHDTPAKLIVMRDGILVAVLSNTVTSPSPSTSVRVRFFQPRINSFEFEDLDPGIGPNELTIDKTSLPTLPGGVTYDDVGDGSITALTDGGFAVVFKATAQPLSGTQTDIFVQCYDVNRNTVGSPEQANTTVGAAPSSPRVIPRRDAGFTVVWEADDGPPTGNQTGLFCRTFRNIDSNPVSPTNPDFFQTDEGVQLRFTVEDLLANDPSLDPAEYDVSADPADIVAFNGQAVRDPADVDAFLFDPAPGFSGDASVQYKLTHSTTPVDGIAFINVVPQNNQVGFNPGVTFSGVEDQDLILTRQDLLSIVTTVDAVNFNIVDWRTDIGTLTEDGPDNYRLTPPPDFHGQITISFEVSDGTDTVIGTAEVLIAQQPDAPVGVDSVMRFSDQEVFFRHVLSGTDADGDTLTFTLDGANPDHKVPVAGGSIQLVDANDTPVASNTTGTVTFTEDAVLANETVLSFSFTVTDDARIPLSGTGTVTLERYSGLSAQTLSGGSGNDLLIGSDGNDRFLPGAGEDRVIGRGGQDTVVFTNRAEDYLLTQNADGSVNVIDTTGVDGLTRVSEVEFLEFNDQTVRLEDQIGGGGAVTVVLGDSLTVQEDGTNPVDSAVSVLTNDRDIDFGTLTVIAVNHQVFAVSTTVPTLFGRITMASDGTYSYELDNANPAVNALTEGQTLTDCIVYSVKDSRGAVHQAALTVTIEGAPGFDAGTVAQSAVFNGADEHLSRSFGTPNSRRKFVFSAWVLRTAFGTPQTLLGRNPGPGRAFRIAFTGSDQLELVDVGTGGSGFFYVTEAEYRDVGFYHILVSIDVSDSTAANRVKLFVNGEEVTVWNTSDDPSDTDTHFNQSGVTYDIGRFGTGEFFNGYLSQIIVLDGESIQAGDRVLGDFGSFFNAGSNGKIWTPISDQAAATLAGGALGNSVALTNLIGDGTDASTNGNNFTPTNMSHSANGSSNTPTFAHPIMNPLIIGNSSETFAEGALRVSASGGSDGGTFATMRLPSTGKWEWQVRTNDGDGIVGITSYDKLVASSDASKGVIGGTGDRYDSAHGFRENGQKQEVTASSVTDSPYGQAWSINDTITLRFDADAGTLEFLLNNTSQGVAFSGLDSTAGFVPFSARISDYSHTYVFVEEDFTFPIGNGFKPLNSANLPVPQHQGADHFDALLHSGTGADQTVLGAGFQADLLWNKGRLSPSTNHYLQDTIRGFGANKSFSSNTNGPEASAGTPAGHLVTVNPNGFDLVGGGDFNTAGQDYVNWLFKRGPHFDIVEFTGTKPTPQSVSHNLGGTPEMMILKNYEAGFGNHEATVFHKALSNSQVLLLSFTNTASTDVNAWNSTDPTASNFTVGDSNNLNEAGRKIIAYLFRSVPGLCSVGSYIGNGSADGPYVNCGFEPRWLMIKRAVGGNADWVMFDAARDPFNVAERFLKANNSDLETTAGARDLDILSNGFKLRGGSEGETNTNGHQYIFLAIASIAGGGDLPPVPGR